MKAVQRKIFFLDDSCELPSSLEENGVNPDKPINQPDPLLIGSKRKSIDAAPSPIDAKKNVESIRSQISVGVFYFTLFCLLSQVDRFMMTL